ERPLVEQQLDTLARRELAAFVLRINARLAAAKARLLTTLLELIEDVFHGVKPCPAESRLVKSSTMARGFVVVITWGTSGGDMAQNLAYGLAPPSNPAYNPVMSQPQTAELIQ